ncbi:MULTISPECIES: hypothetical protein [Protofrankia]|uniref:PASTA domain-containing protein n=1 Tax=Protofrankia coriariae TaxID=1562887 RepID=A0ABR5EZL4_9ACTN|nr:MULTISPECIES: hypothetical protein [Protofrankia]KLL09896.1 hypothetical protein FrCorBMG51_21700 [Protofrankia coriariae]ONH38127.1 hypothetical protein BL254_01535 [Protofrankia sp. BMG5.30]
MVGTAVTRARGASALPPLMALLVLLGAAGGTGCASSDGFVSAPGAPDASGPAAPTRTVATGTLPNLIGKGLQYAQDTAQTAGFTNLTSHDALGRGREQILDRQWQVCDQSPAAGPHPVTVRVDFGVVHLDETCPRAGEADTALPRIGPTMPDLAGRSLKVVRAAFGDNASVTVHDATGADRIAIVESNWKICSTVPATGRPYSRGTPVTLNIAKFEESCP